MLEKYNKRYTKGATRIESRQEEKETTKVDIKISYLNYIIRINIYTEKL